MLQQTWGVEGVAAYVLLPSMASLLIPSGCTAAGVLELSRRRHAFRPLSYHSPTSFLSYPHCFVKSRSLAHALPDNTTRGSVLGAFWALLSCTVRRYMTCSAVHTASTSCSGLRPDRATTAAAQKVRSKSSMASSAAHAVHLHVKLNLFWSSACRAPAGARTPVPR